MGEADGCLQHTHQSSRSVPSLLHALDPMSLILSQISSPHEPVPLRLMTESYIMERGPRYSAYAQLRESKLRMKSNHSETKQQQECFPEEEDEREQESKRTPVKKQVKFSANLVNTRKGPSVLAQSVPDFSATLRKENRKPPSMLPSLMELTPPSKKWAKGDDNNGVLANSIVRRSKSANAGEKKGGLMRKSYASIEDLKKISHAAASAINGENRGKNGRGGIAGNKTVLGYRQF